MPAGTHNMHSFLLKVVYVFKWSTVLLRGGKLSQENGFLSYSANVVPSPSTEAYPLRKTIVHLGISVVTHSVSLPLTLQTPKPKPSWKGWLFSEPLWVSLQVRCSLKCSLISGSILALVVVAALNTIHQESHSALLPQVSLLCILCRAAKREGEFDFNFNLGWSLSLGMGLARVPPCWLTVYSGDLAPHLVTGWGIWQGCIQKGPGTEIVGLNDTHAHTHTYNNKKKNMDSYTVLVENCSCLSEGHKEPLVVEVSFRSQWKMAASPAVQVIIPDL